MPAMALTDTDVVRLWERGRALGATGRALLAVEYTAPESRRDEVRRWPLGQRDAHLFDLRRALFGRRMPTRSACPRCHAELEFELDANALQSRCAGVAPEAERIVEGEGLRIRLRAPTSEDLLALEAAQSVAAAEALLWSRCVEVSTADGDSMHSQALPEALRRQVEEHIESLDPLADVSLDLRCESCEFRWQAPYDIAHVLWKEIAQRAAQLLHEVHVLARAYGWSESEILALRAWRRELYLAWLE
jgi:hypothetical protein